MTKKAIVPLTAWGWKR